MRTLAERPSALWQRLRGTSWVPLSAASLHTQVTLVSSGWLQVESSRVECRVGYAVDREGLRRLDRGSWTEKDQGDWTGKDPSDWKVCDWRRRSRLSAMPESLRRRHRPRQRENTLHLRGCATLRGSNQNLGFSQALLNRSILVENARRACPLCSEGKHSTAIVEVKQPHKKTTTTKAYPPRARGPAPWSCRLVERAESAPR